MAEAMKTLEAQDLAKLRDTCLNNTFAFGKIVMGFDALDPDFHGMLGAWIQKPTRRKLGLAPRGHFKSTVWTMADKLRRVTKDPQLEILIVNEKELNIVKWIGYMQATVLSELYRALFPEAVPDLRKVRWNALQLELNRKAPRPQACIEGQGITSALASNHYDIVVADDLVSDEASRSALVMQDAVDKRKRFDSLLKSMKTSEIHDVCTRWGPHDPADWILKNESDIDYLKLNVWKSPGVPWFPSFFPIDELEKLRRKYGPRDWAMLYMNEIVGDGASRYDPGLLRYWRLLKDMDDREYFVLETNLGEKRVALEDCLSYQIIDAGLNPESKDARTAIVTAYLTPPTDTTPFDIVIVEAKAKPATPAEVIAEAKAIYDRWNPLFTSIETFGGHQAFFAWLSLTYPAMRIRELKKDFSRNAKHKRINGFWGSYPNQGRVYVHRAHTDLLDELVSYPNGATVDLLDAAGYLPTVWSPPSPAKAGPQRPKGVSDFDLHDYDPEETARSLNEGRSSQTGY